MFVFLSQTKFKSISGNLNDWRWQQGETSHLSNRQGMGVGVMWGKDGGVGGGRGHSYNSHQILFFLHESIPNKGVQLVIGHV